MAIGVLLLNPFSLDDAYLQRLATAVPRGSILLVEDIDCAFPSREDEEDAGAADPRRRGPNIVGGTFMPPGGYRPPTGVTLSGLLNVIDGVGSDEGRLFFATASFAGL
jgi:chaperone BCS1